MSFPCCPSLFKSVWFRFVSFGEPSPHDGCALTALQRGWRGAGKKGEGGRAAAGEQAGGTALDRSIAGTAPGPALPFANLLPRGQGKSRSVLPIPAGCLGLLQIRPFPRRLKRLAPRCSEPAACRNATPEL